MYNMSTWQNNPGYFLLNNKFLWRYVINAKSFVKHQPSVYPMVFYQNIACWICNKIHPNNSAYIADWYHCDEYPKVLLGIAYRSI